MQRTEFTKAEKRQLRSLAAAAYERELANALAGLERSFRGWRGGEINAFDLSDDIHQFHNGVARELWKYYSNVPVDTAVATALTRGALAEDEIPEGLRSKLPRWVV